MRGLILLTLVIFLSGCFGMNVVRNSNYVARNTYLDQVPKTYLTKEELKRMNDDEIREFFDM